MEVRIKPSNINGAIHAPSSKSAMQRACALALLHEGETIIRNPGKSNDDLAAIAIIQKLGAVVRNDLDGSLIVKGFALAEPSKASITGEGLVEVVNCGESGLGLRMFAPIAALSSEELLIHGEGSLLNRPINSFVELFPRLGVAIETRNGKLPIKIKGPLQARDISIEGSLSSQFLTGFLMAFAKAATKQVTITVINLKSKPYIDLTLQMMRHFGYEIEHDQYEKFFIKPQTEQREIPLNSGTTQYPHPKTPFKILTYTVEGDWSSAAFLLVAGAIAGKITVHGINIFSTQADKAILEALKMAGADISVHEESVGVNPRSGNFLKAFYFNATDCPDLFPPLVSLAAYCEGTSVITGVNRLQHKESNRAITLQEEFAKMGVGIKLEDDLMLITGGKARGALVHSHHDHRIAMACAVAALRADGETTIQEAASVKKSYPGFFEDLKMLGANVSLPINTRTD